MAIDRALLDLAAGEGEVLLRLYRWQPACLSFGRHEPATRRYDRERIAARGMDCVRRPTGGRAVWHARELTYAVVGPIAVLGGLREAYRQIHGWLAAAITGLGAPATLAAAPSRTPRPGEGACFAAPVGGEVLVEGWKVVGSAQLRLEGALLQHGSVLLEDDQAIVRAVATLSDPRPPAERPLAEILGRPVSWVTAAAAVEASVRERWTGSVFDEERPEAALIRARDWEATFRSDRWTWDR